MGPIAADDPGEAEELAAPDLDSALAAVGELLSPGPPRAVPSGWCSWSQYFHDVAERVLASAPSARR